MTVTTLALVGATGGAGTTRTAVELAAMGARDGRDVAVIDVAYATQGLSEYVPGRIDIDVTTLITDRPAAPLSAGMMSIPLTGGTDGEGGRMDLLPARAPFERIARAKTADAAQALESRIAAAERAFDVVLLDTPPVASNEAVAAVTTADRVAAVHPSTPHGRDACQRLCGRVADVGATVETTIAVAREPATSNDEVAADADVSIPPTDPAVTAAPTAIADEDTYARAIAGAFESLFDTTVDVEPTDAGLFDRIR